MCKFRPIPEHPEYLINKKSEVFSLKSNKLLKKSERDEGYFYHSFGYGGKVKHYLTHRLLARVFLDLPSLCSDLQVDHIDRDRKNNQLSNLQVLTPEEHRKKTNIDLGHTEYKEKFCTRCNKLLGVKTAGGICNTCIQNSRPKPSVEDIEYWVTKHSWVRASKELGLSDNGLRKRYRKLTGKDPKLLKKKPNIEV